MGSIDIKNGSLKFDGQTIRFFRRVPCRVSGKLIDEYLSHKFINIVETDCGYTIKVDALGIIGMSIPCENAKLRIANEIDYCDPRFTNRYYYSTGPNNLKNIYDIDASFGTVINSPIVHVVHKDKCFSFSTDRQEMITTNFKDAYVQHVNMVVYATDSCSFFIDIASNYLINLQRFAPTPFDIYKHHSLDVNDIKKSLIQKSTVVDACSTPIDIFDTAREVQQSLMDKGITSVITGSTSQHLNGIPTIVNDLDLMIKNKADLIDAMLIMEDIGAEASYHENRASFRLNSIKIDMCYDNYNIMDRHGMLIDDPGQQITYLSLEGLLWIHLLLMYAINRNEYPNTTKSKNLQTLFKLVRKNNEIHDQQFGTNSIVADIEGVNNFSEKCIEFCQELSGYERAYLDIKINDPFSIAIFESQGNFIIPIVNNGSRNNARIIVPFYPESASWEDISNKTREVRVEKHEDFSILFINQIFLPGLLRIVNA